MNRCAILLVLSLIFISCGDSPYYHEFDLDQHTFKEDTLKKIKNDIDIDFPEKTKGLNFHYIPPIDPIVFAKIEIPATARKLVETRISKYSDNSSSFPTNFDVVANDKCSWWPPKIENIILTRKTYHNSYYVLIHLVQENEKHILFLKYMTI